MTAGKVYYGQDIEVAFDLKRCVHSRRCTMCLPDVFDEKAKPWISPDGDRAEAVAAFIKTCPSGALTYHRRDGGAQEEAPPKNFVRLWEHGPLEFNADLQANGESIGYRATLCRCGASKNKPFCDNSHRDMGFKATGEAKPKDVEENQAPPGGPIQVAAFENGPLHITGSLEVVAGSGHHIAYMTEAFLCRCGHSANKPFCDGTHNKIGFQAEGFGST